MIIPQFYFNREEPYDILAVGDWSQKLSFFQLSGKQVNINVFFGCLWFLTLPK